MSEPPSIASRPAPVADRIAGSVDRLSPAERRVARCLIEQQDAVLLGSAAAIAALAGTSDATVVRTVRALGFGGLSDLRQMLLADVIGAPTPSNRLRRTLEAAGEGSAQALDHVLALHEDALDVMKSPAFQAGFARSVDVLFAGRRRHVFGIGPSGAMADYASLQFNRIGLASTALSASGVALADRMMTFAEGDAVLVIAYAPLYREVDVLVGRAKQLGNPVVLISDSLGPILSDRVAEVLPVPRGRADHLSMHGGTMVLIEALIVGLAARDRDTAIASLETLSDCRGAIDKAWRKRGIKSRTSI